MLRQARADWQLYAIILLPLIYILVFRYFPMYGAQIAFKRFNPVKGIAGSPWIGLANFQRFLGSYEFARLLTNTLALSLYGLAAGFPIPVILAISLNYSDSAAVRKVVQMTTYAPYFISTVVLVGMMMQFLSPRIGMINHLIVMAGGEPVDFMGKPELFRSIYVWSGIWQSAGYNAIIYLAVLSSVDPELHEAAIVDGASKLQRIRWIDLPGLMPTATILLILNFGRIMNVGFEKAYLMQNPLNTSTSEVIQTYVYKIGLASEVPSFAYSAAIGLFDSVISFLLLIVVNWFAKRVGETSLW